ncbi:MAG: response regulator transcription factor [Saprospiraceae bacterium]|nr:MAG: response regulator transcription factor [Saprospiraceae bacterium]
MTILLCAADEPLLTTFEFRFRKKGWILNVAPDKAIAMQKVETLSPDLVIVDLQLPGYAGLDIIQSLRNIAGDDLPIIATALLEDDRIMMEALRLGADDFIIKPYKPDELILRMQRLFHAVKVVD